MAHTFIHKESGMELVNIGFKLTMSSLEIAELTGKVHADVLRDIEKMFSDLNIDATDFAGTCKTPQGNKYKCYNLPKRETLILVSGYSTELRARVINRRQELVNKIVASMTLQEIADLFVEGMVKKTLPDANHPLRATRAWVDEAEQILQMDN